MYIKTKSYFIQELIRKPSLTSFTQHFLSPPTSPHQFSSASTSLAASLLPHLLHTPNCLHPSPQPPHLPQGSLAISFLFLHSLALSPCVPFPASPSTPLWTWPWICAPRVMSLGGWFDLWLGKCFEESWEEPRALTGVLWLHLLSAQKMEEIGSPWMLCIFTWQCCPVLYSPSSIYVLLRESMAYDGKVTGLYYWSSIVILCSLPFSVSQYQSQLGPLAILSINCPEVHAQLFIMQVSQTKSFITELIWNLLGWCSSWRLSVTVFIHAKESGNVGASWKLLTLTGWLYDCWLIKQVLWSVSHICQLTST